MLICASSLPRSRMPLLPASSTSRITTWPLSSSLSSPLGSTTGYLFFDGLGRQPPIDDHLEIAVFLLRPEVLVLRLFALRSCRRSARPNPSAASGRRGPSACRQPARSRPVYSGTKPRASAAISVGRGIRRGQLLDLQVAEVALRAFRLQADVALPRAALAAAGDFLAVDGQLEHAVVAGDAVVVPLGRGLAALLAGQAALGAVAGAAGRASSSRPRCGTRRRGWCRSRRIAAVEHLHLDRRG